MANSDKSQAQSKQTTVEEGTELRGTLHSRCEVVVRGTIDGTLTAPSVVVSETGTVVGNVKADCIRSEGVLAGNVDADDVYLSGTVRSDTVIRARNLEVKLKRDQGKLEVSFGACVLEVGEDPAAEAKTSAGKSAAPKSAAELRASQPAPAATAPEMVENANGRSAGEEPARKDRRSVPPPS